MIEISGDNLSMEKIVAIARNKENVKICDEARKNVVIAREMVEDCVEQEKVIYGLTTGFGKLCDVRIPKEDTTMLQRNLIMSHACGVGDYFSEDVARGVMLIRANHLLRGNSGIRPETVQCLVDMLNKEVYPVIYKKGSLGASGDLVPLAHMTLVMMGMGEAVVDGKIVPGKEAMDRAGVECITLAEKEGLALINGTQVLTAVGALATYDAIRLAKFSDIVGALTMEALQGITDAFSPLISSVRPYDGQRASGENFLKLLEGSAWTTRQGELRVQDAYSLRCIPQVHGASKDTLSYVAGKVDIELNAVTDNPLIFPDEKEIISAGNFHGEPLAQPFDFLAIGLAEIANISERRIERLVNPMLNDGLPAFLTEHQGINSGYMIAQYTAASLVSENKVLAHPASVDSIPSSANQEDLVSMGTIAARKAAEIVNNVRQVLAIELLTACQAIDLRKKGQLGKGTKPAYDILRREVPYLDKDRENYKDIRIAASLIEEIIEATEKAVGPLKMQ